MHLPISDRDLCTCYYCSIYHKTVEASGIWYCPNPLCTGPGAAWFRVKLKSYQERESTLGGTHTVDELEAVLEAVKLAKDEKDEVIKNAIIESVAKWI